METVAVMVIGGSSTLEITYRTVTIGHRKYYAIGSVVVNKSCGVILAKDKNAWGERYDYPGGGIYPQNFHWFKSLHPSEKQSSYGADSLTCLCGAELATVLS